MIPLYAAHSKWVIFVLVFSITYEGMYPTKVVAAQRFARALLVRVPSAALRTGSSTSLRLG
jgi:hypothetical protein